MTRLIRWNGSGWLVAWTLVTLANAIALAEEVRKTPNTSAACVDRVLFADNFDSVKAGTMPTVADLNPTATVGRWGIAKNHATTLQVVNNETPESAKAGVNQYLHQLRGNGDGSSIFATGWPADATKGQTVELCCDVWLSDRSSVAALAAFTGKDFTGRSFNVYLDGDGRVQFHDGSALVATGLAMKTGVWHRAVVTADMAARTFSIALDDQTPYTAGYWNDAVTTVSDIYIGTNSVNHAVSFDNVQIQIVRGVQFAASHAPARPAALAMEECDGVQKLRLLPPGRNNPRNSEGDFIQLADGRILFIYSHFTGGKEDHGTAHLAGRYSSDGGKTWTGEDVIVVPNEGRQNIMSVSLLRLADGRIALFYMRKNSLADCRPVMRISTDEAKTWSEPTLSIGDDDIGYYVLNNDRAVQLKSGRILLPMALHNRPGWKEPDWDGEILCWFSDDGGRTWRLSKDRLKAETAGKRVTTQEPGVVELDDGRVFLFCRTNAGSQYVSYSSDDGDTWSPLVPSSMRSPCSPATIKRIPKTGDLILVWNDYSDSAQQGDGPRTPLRVAVSRDDGRTWEHVKTLEGDPQGHYCYTALEFVGPKDVLLGYCAGSLKEFEPLVQTQLTRVSLDWLYK